MSDIGQHIKPEVIWNIEKGIALTVADLHQAELKRGELYRSMLNYFDHYDLLICPSAILPPFDVSIRYPEALNGIKFENYVSWLNVTAAVTLTSCPSISVPCGFTKTGLPVGLQIVGPPRREDKLLAAASVFENAHKIDQKTPINPKHQDH